MIGKTVLKCIWYYSIINEILLGEISSNLKCSNFITYEHYWFKNIVMTVTYKSLSFC